MCIRDRSLTPTIVTLESFFVEVIPVIIWLLKVFFVPVINVPFFCLLYTSDAADDSLRVDLGGRRIIKKSVAVLHKEFKLD